MIKQPDIKALSVSIKKLPEFSELQGHHIDAPEVLDDFLAIFKGKPFPLPILKQEWLRQRDFSFPERNWVSDLPCIQGYFTKTLGEAWSSDPKGFDTYFANSPFPFFIEVIVEAFLSKELEQELSSSDMEPLEEEIRQKEALDEQEAERLRKAQQKKDEILAKRIARNRKKFFKSIPSDEETIHRRSECGNDPRIWEVIQAVLKMEQLEVAAAQALLQGINIENIPAFPLPPELDLETLAPLVPLLQSVRLRTVIIDAGGEYYLGENTIVALNGGRSIWARPFTMSVPEVGQGEIILWYIPLTR